MTICAPEWKGTKTVIVLNVILAVMAVWVLLDLMSKPRDGWKGE